MLWRRKWQPTPVFFPGESHGQRSLVDYSPRVTKSRIHDWSDVVHTHSSALNQSNQLSLILCRSIVHRATQYSCVTSMSLSVSVTVLANNSKQWNKSRNRKMRKKNYYYWGLFYDTNNTKRFEKNILKIVIFEWLDDGHIPFFCIFFYITKISTLAMYRPNLKNVI